MILVFATVIIIINVAATTRADMTVDHVYIFIVFRVFVTMLLLDNHGR